MSSDPSAVDFSRLLEEERELVNRRLEDIVAGQASAADYMREALVYVLLDGGKRLRPLLCLWTHDMLGGTRRDPCLDVACAIECMHTYSLVHDDLPCMDDDAMRRGKPSCHVKFGEAIAVLTGDALLTLCFEHLATLGERWEIDSSVVVNVMQVISRGAGADGLITGQALDLMSDKLEPNLQTVVQIHERKTAALITSAMTSGAIMAGANASELARIERAGMLAGGAFQIVDDVLDVQMDGETLGKTPGKDAKDGKLTYPSVVGLEASKKRALEMVTEAKLELGAVARDSATQRRDHLNELLDLFVSRSK